MPATIQDAIREADAILPGVPAPEDERDPRWQAIIAVGEFIETHPEEVWSFTARWGCHEQEDLRLAVSCCLLEHLLQHHFDAIFPRVAELAMSDPRFADTFGYCSKFGQSEIPRNSRRLDELARACGQTLFPLAPSLFQRLRRDLGHE